MRDVRAFAASECGGGSCARKKGESTNFGRGCLRKKIRGVYLRALLFYLGALCVVLQGVPPRGDDFGQHAVVEVAQVVPHEAGKARGVGPLVQERLGGLARQGAQLVQRRLDLTMHKKGPGVEGEQIL